MQIERNLQIRASGLDVGSDLTAAMNFDQIRQCHLVKLVQIGFGKANIAAMPPATANGKRAEVAILKRGIHSRAENPDCLWCFAAAHKIGCDGCHRPGIGWREFFLMRQQQMIPRCAVAFASRHRRVRFGR